MYQLGRLIEPLQRYYAGLLRRELVQPVVSKDLATLSDFGLRYASLPPGQKPSEEEQRAFYDRLKLHLLLSQPRAKGEPPLEAAAPWLQAQLQSHFEQAVPNDAELKKAAQVNAELYVAFLREFSELPFPRDSEVVKRVREALNRLDLTQRAIARLVAMAGKNGSDVGLAQLVGPTEVLRERRKVRAAFTHDGFTSVVRDALKPELLDEVGELWVLGSAEAESDKDEQRKRQLTALRTAYFTQYITEWFEFLNGLSILDTSDFPSALRNVQELTRVPSPLQTLFGSLRDQVKLPVPEQSEPIPVRLREGMRTKLNELLVATFGVGDVKAASPALAKRLNPSAPELPTLTESDVDLAFQNIYGFGVPKPTAEGATAVPTQLSDYLAQLMIIRNALQVYLDTPSEGEQLRSSLHQARLQVDQIIQRQPGLYQTFFKNLLQPPVRGAVAGSGRVEGEKKGGAWCNEVVAEYAHNIAGQYPFDRNGQDLSLSALANFYRPKDGKLWSVVDSTFGTIVSLEGDHYTFTRRFGEDASNTYSSSLLDFLARSRDVMLAFFPNGAEPKLEFEVKVHPSPSVAKTQFMVGGKSVEHYNGPEQWKALVWPGDKPSEGATITIRGANGMHEQIKQDGEWGLFRLLEAGTLQSAPGQTFTVAWQLQTHDVTLQVDFRTKRGVSPVFGVPPRLGGSLMHPVRGRNVAPPKQISGGAGCK
jgi:type VI secretion system protein ImpL